MPQENVEVAKAFYEAYNARDTEAVELRAVLVVRDSQIVLVDSYSSWEDALEAGRLRA
jgi:hypothetical protein